ncbi:MAG: M42 family metallopeptidase [Candidatus Hodarchaeales archaeon]
MDLEDIKTMQKELSELVGLPGYEDDVSAFIIEKMKPYVDSIWKDPLGNVLAIKEGTENENRILLDAHTDEVGFMISHIENEGFLRFVLLGGFDNRIFLGKSVIIRNNVGKLFHGIIGSTPPHLLSAEDRKKMINISDLYIDIGMASEGEVKSNNIDIGSTGVLYDPFVEFPNGMIRGKAFDDRTGCNILIQIAKMIAEGGPLKDTILFSFSVQEEVGGRGAVTATYKLKPTMALALENTTAADVPGVEPKNCPVVIGKGPSITIADNSMLSSPKINNRLIKNAEKENIPFQIKKPKFGGTNAGKIHISRHGVPSSVVCVPCRYIHSPVSLLKLDDIVLTIKLVLAFILNPAKV